MRRLPLLVLLLAACSSDPAPTDSGMDVAALDNGDAVVGTDPAPFLDRGFDASVDAGDVVDAFIGTEPIPLLDIQTPDVPFDTQPGLMDGCGLDPDGACIVPGDVPPDQGVPDAGADVTAVADADDVPSADVALVEVGTGGAMGPENTAMACMDGFDNDNDGFADCADFDCSRDNPAVTSCHDADAGPADGGAPDGGAPDGGAPDAGAPDAGAPDSGSPGTCGAVGSESTASMCADGVDNDCDGFADCADLDCPASACRGDGGADATAAGPVVFDLEVTRTAVEYAGRYRRTIGDAGQLDCVAAPTATSCSVTAGTLRFAFTQCGVDFVGTFTVPPGTDDRSLSLGIGGATHLAPSPTISVGPLLAGTPVRRSFHIQYARTVDGAAPGAEGIPGSTVDPARGDIWVLGCLLD